ncbi:MAG: pyruvate kinase [Desulfobacteraceae bacterium]|nr:MAG: pyruvate kinase [Desulfobacteraceae bacterium]
MTVKTKIVCTIGPASRAPECIQSLIANGMSVARLNFSHGTHAEHQAVIQSIRTASEALDRPVAILQDLSGPKIRIGSLPEGGIQLETGRTFILSAEPVNGNAQKVSVTYPDLYRDVQAGDPLMLADGEMELVVKKVAGFDIICEVITGGILTGHKGINLPTRTLGMPALTEKDRLDLAFGLKHEVDFVALSFVRTAEEIHQTRAIIRQHGRETPIIAKIEKHEALKNIDEIVEAADGLMVARGDLGVEIPLEQVPHIQKMLIQKANRCAKPVITATQMLRSMVSAPRPTRAEATDVANAVLDGTDAVMLSEETAVGRYPIEAVAFMARIAGNAEQDFPHQAFLKAVPAQETADAVAHAACVLADHLNAAAIVVHTHSGRTARAVARFRPKQPVIALSPLKKTIQVLPLFWGCVPLFITDTPDFNELSESTEYALLQSGLVRKGDLIVLTAGLPLGVPGTTNMIKVKTL